MNKLYTLIIMLGIFISCTDDPEQSFEVDDSQLSEDMRIIYINDASRLALRDVFENNSDQTNNVEIDSDIFDKYYFALVNINNSNSTESILVIDSLSIHTINNPELYKIGLAIGQNIAWSNSWDVGDESSGKTEVDDLFIEYDLELVEKDTILNLNYFTIESSVRINIQALIDEFENVGSISWAESAGILPWDGDDIIGVRHSDNIEIVYHYKWGDCPSGCINDHWWTFQVDHDGAVSYLGEFGDDLP